MKPTRPPSSKRIRHSILTLALTLCCLLAGYGFYKMDPHEPVVAGIFTFGILGILLSVLRNRES